MIFHNANEGFGTASEVVKLLELEDMLREVTIAVGCDDGVNVGWKLGRRDDRDDGEGEGGGEG